MSKPQPGAEEYRSAAITFVAVFALIAVALMTKMSISEIFAPNALLIIGALSLLAAAADFVIKYRRLQRGIRTEDLVRQVERDIATGQHFVVRPQFRWSLMIAGVVGGGLVFLLSRLLGLTT